MWSDAFLGEAGGCFVFAKPLVGHTVEDCSLRNDGFFFCYQKASERSPAIEGWGGGGREGRGLPPEGMDNRRRC